MASVYAYKRLNEQIKDIKHEISEELIQLLNENDIKEGQIIISDNSIALRIKSSEVKTTLFRHIDKYIGSAGRISIEENDLFLTYEL